MTLLSFLLLLVCLFVGNLISQKNGPLIGFFVWAAMIALISIVLAAERGIANVLVLIATFVLPLLASIGGVRLLCRYEFGKKWLKMDHQGAGCLTYCVLYGISFYLVGEILSSLFL